MGSIRYAGISDCGCKREQNQDRIVVAERLGLFAVADGMGGERCGEWAAEIAVQTVEEYLGGFGGQREDDWPFEFDPTLNVGQNRVMNGVRLANRRIWETCRHHPDCAGMGTTVSLLLLSPPDTATIGSVGDSRVYLLRDSQLRLLTRDDAVVADMIDKGEIKEEQAHLHPMRNVLTSALGSSEDVVVQLVQFKLKHLDRLMLCSDGMHAVVRHDTLKHLLGRDGGPSVVARNLQARRSEA
jgi:protein phosphatase